jgi:hypothetical protein
MEALICPFEADPTQSLYDRKVLHGIQRIANSDIKFTREYIYARLASIYARGKRLDPSPRAASLRGS